MVFMHIVVFTAKFVGHNGFIKSTINYHKKVPKVQFITIKKYHSFYFYTRVYRIFKKMFITEENRVVCFFLFYSKQKNIKYSKAAIINMRF